MDYVIDLSYTENGFFHSFNANQDIYGKWSMHWLVMHHFNTNKIYLGEYTKFRKRILTNISRRNLEDTSQLRHLLDDAYAKVIIAYIKMYVARLHINKPADISLYEYGQTIMNRFQRIIDKFSIDINVTRVYQPGKIAFHFTWNGDILASTLQAS
jgi:hypothetical protein